MRLAQTQGRLFEAIAERKSDGIEQLIQPGRRLSAAQRVEIYAQMYLWRQVDALEEDFPKLAALLGEGEFAHLVEDYVKAYPSEHPSLGRLGRKLAQFISERGSESLRPDLADLAGLEWARAEVFVERDSPSVPADAFARLAPERFGQAKCRLCSAWRLLHLRHDPMPLWQAIENGEPALEANPVERHILVWRKGWSVYHAAVDPDEARALERAREGATLGEVCEAFAGADQPAAAAFAALQSWIGEGLVASVDAS